MASASLYIRASTYIDVIANAKTRALTPNTNIMHIAHKFSLSLRERKKTASRARNCSFSMRYYL